MMTLSIYLKAALLAGTGLFCTCCGTTKEEKMGSYAYDARFLHEHGVEFTELVSADGNSKVLVIPSWQGRVMTTTASGDAGDSYGWINYRFIREGKKHPQFNPVGGEERFWLGPEGGPFSLYFRPGQEQVYENWIVPPVLDTEAFEIESQTAGRVHFVKATSLTNASGSRFDMRIDRTVSLMSPEEVAAGFGIRLSDGMKLVAYRSDNRITNTGDRAWTKAGGLVSVWMLGMFNPTPTTTVFIPYETDADGPVVNDTYFGKIPSDRLIMENGILYFKIDGRYRSKLGLPASRAKGICGSYDSSKGVLTLLRCTLPEAPAAYVNGQWGEQDDPFAGDVINSYNDGPVEDGSVMGPFYEIETSSPGAELLPGASLLHTQQVVHLQGESRQLAPIVRELFGADLETVRTKFRTSQTAR